MGDVEGQVGVSRVVKGLAQVEQRLSEQVSGDHLLFFAMLLLRHLIIIYLSSTLISLNSLGRNQR